MNNTTEPCLSKDELRDYTLGRLPESKLETVASHLETCVTCEDTISSLEDTADSLIDHLQLPPSRQRNGTPEYIAAIQKMKNAQLPVSNSSPLPAEIDDTNITSSANETLIRDYKLISILGAGGMGTVYKAIHTKLDRIVALKLLPAKRIGNSEAIARFEREMKAIGKLNHPVVVRATDAGEDDDQHFLAMEFVDGFDVSQLIERHGPLNIADACEIIRQAATGLQHVHEQGLVHRDIKPSNLMVTFDGQVKILDLGLALLGEAHDGMDELTTVGQMMGTVDYMAPEQCDDSHDVDIRADIYSLGATLFKTLTGNAPFVTAKRRSPLSRIRALATEDAPRVSDCIDNIPKALDEAIEAMLAREPELRFRTPDEVVNALSQFTAGHDLPNVVRIAAKAPAPDKVALGVPHRFKSVRQLPPENPGQTTAIAGRVIKYVAFLAAIIVTAIVFRLQTDKGELIVECDVPNVEVVLLKDGIPHQELSLRQGQTSLSVFSGKYEIKIPSASDSIEVTADKFTISRGAKIIAQIRHIQSSANPDEGTAPRSEPRLNAPTYEGMTFSEWESRLSDRSHTQMISAISAIGILGVDANADEAARLIFEAVKHLFRTSAELRQPDFSGNVEASVRLAAVTAFRTLLNDPEAVEFLRELLTKEDTAARRFATTVLKRIMNPHIGNDAAAEKAAKELVPALLAASYDDNIDLRQSAIYPLYDMAKSNPAIINRYVELLDSNDYGEMEDAAQCLYDLAPDKRKLIGDAYMKCYLKNIEMFHTLRDTGKSKATLGEWSIDWMQTLQVAIECGADAKQTELELLAILENPKGWASHRAQAAYLLGKYSNDNQRIASSLLAILTDKTSPLDKECRVQLYKLAKEQDVAQTRNKVRMDVILVEALGNLREASSKAVPHLNSIVSMERFGSGNFSLSQSDVEFIQTTIEALSKIGLNADSVAALERLQQGSTPLSSLAQSALRKLPENELKKLKKSATPAATTP